MEKKLIYFLCTGNSCRSQMAEGFGKALLGDRFEVRSAGIEAHGLNPEAVRAMAEAGIDISGQQSETISTDLLKRADYVITLCGDARDNCPAVPTDAVRDHWGFDDPARALGTEEEKRAVFRRVRDEIRDRIMRFSETGE
ncbi:Arsenate reductase [Bhargavaea cecembensis DSE10]|uniref:Arsenate reductase n=1 Tax=Bhargavaea cecembensis DSE10 TaxID=1235279 RepID=M7NZF4_9BACL|nr:arsenate reductase (thioredoxin) [Bhargavaea cecembensis]EMR07055.1 Arsenate reductase [Bhargavaea cecembensis DSE10]